MGKKNLFVWLYGWISAATVCHPVFLLRKHHLFCDQIWTLPTCCLYCLENPVVFDWNVFSEVEGMLQLGSKIQEMRDVE